MNYDWDFSVVIDALPAFAAGAAMTLLLSVIVFASSTVLGLVLCFFRMSRVAPVKMVTVAVVEFLRLTPLLVQILWIYYSLPLAIGVALSPFWSGVIALSINASAFTSEIFRSAFESIDPGQREAGEALGMTRTQLARRVLIPNATRRVLAPLGTAWVSTFQDTSLIAVLGVAELMRVAQVISTETLRPVEAFTAVGIIYFLLAYPQARLVDWYQRRNRLRT